MAARMVAALKKNHATDPPDDGEKEMPGPG